ncbi:hypothetical protein GII33_16265 [Gordonia pseudamarae]|uniref:Uncharacterized protein n=1 Tax=Gordonia pseudamarae TaxID=2831662 RepID=A0ABX6IJS5_9ACTN|nr:MULTISPECIES: hypothetical protein [Gordonia]MBD0024401.1 hypothetical protein [Gordonia sp. (in: high G+C Gram-positive bacteria)]QHN27275.1 hypothetical protein GII33_16265 [Gordonia pseudamarae]QHN36158.1 hypothetical protein GII31_16040 [Gordonia pseudamarae]
MTASRPTDPGPRRRAGFGVGRVADHRAGAAGLLAVCGAIATLLCLYAANWVPGQDPGGSTFVDAARRVPELCGTHARPGWPTTVARAFFVWGHGLLAAAATVTAIAVLAGRRTVAVIAAVLSAGLVGWMEAALKLSHIGDTEWTRYLSVIGVALLAVGVGVAGGRTRPDGTVGGRR